MRRAQAALEYLITYGWGFVALLIVFGALAYFGVLSPSKYLPQRCDLGTQLECVDFLLWEPSGASDHGRIRLILRNNFGDDIAITRFWVGSEEPNLATTIYCPFVDPNCGPGIPGVLTVTPAAPIAIVQGNISLEFQVRIPNTNPLIFVEDERLSVPITVEFRRNVAGAPLHNVSGTIFGTVREQ